jgi:hypothetical protein
MTTHAEIVNGLQAVALGRELGDQETTVTFTWPVREPLVRCGLCFCAVPKDDSRAHADWHGNVVHVGPVVEHRASPERSRP